MNLHIENIKNRIKDKNTLPGVLVRAGIFLCALVFVLTVLTRILWLWDDAYSATVMRDFYHLPENSADVIYIGSSGVKEYYIAGEAYARRGITSYPVAISSQPAIAIPYLIEEVKKTQSPRVFLIDVRELINNGPLWDNTIRKTTDSLRLSANRTALIDRLLSVYREEQPDKNSNKWDFYFSFTTYHNRWEDLKEEDFNGGPVWLGYCIFNESEETPEPGPDRTAENFSPLTLDGHREKALEDLLSYCAGMDEEVIFTITPAAYDDEELGRLSRVEEAIKQAGFTMWDLNRPEVIRVTGIDFQTDMHNHKHVNVYGALKFTDYLSDRLDDTFMLPDHRGEKAFSVWETENAAFRAALVKTETDEDRLEMLRQRGFEVPDQ